MGTTPKDPRTGRSPSVNFDAKCGIPARYLYLYRGYAPKSLNLAIATQTISDRLQRQYLLQYGCPELFPNANLAPQAILSLSGPY